MTEYKPPWPKDAILATCTICGDEFPIGQTHACRDAAWCMRWMREHVRCESCRWCKVYLKGWDGEELTPGDACANEKSPWYLSAVSPDASCSEWEPKS